ncbi:MAG: hypothetical protein IT383_26190 [Deltaproteobacteria bacterium]|nr:hypothetical protein [Deltaproteobacteria bacterium]
MRIGLALIAHVTLACSRAPPPSPAVDVEPSVPTDAGSAPRLAAPATRLVSHIVNGQVYIEEVPVEPGTDDAGSAPPLTTSAPEPAACDQALAAIEAALAAPVDHRVVSAAQEVARACDATSADRPTLARRLDTRAAASSSLRRELLAVGLRVHETASRAMMLGAVADAENDGPAAIDAARHAVALAPNEPVYQIHLADLERRYAVERRFDTIVQEHFIARFEGDVKKDLAWDSLRILDEAWRRVGDLIDLRPSEPITVVFYTGPDYQAATGAREWSGGQFDGKIRIRASSLTQGEAALRDLLYHEYLHAAVATSVRGPVPAWLHEGLAQRVEPGLDRLRDLAPLKGHTRTTLPSLQDLSQGFSTLTDHDQVRLSYACALDIVDELVRSRGERSFAQLFEAMNKGKSFEAAFNDVYQSNERYLDVRWRGRY